METVSTLQEILPGLFLVDCGHFGKPGLGGAYILAGKEVALVDTGTSLAKDRILWALDLLGIARSQVRWIFLTHVHLDHAGGAGVLIPEFPNAKVLVHSRAAKHLVDPAKLLSSTQSAVGERFRFYGTALPIPAERLYIPNDEEVLTVTGQGVQILETPGHAPHHLCFFLPESGLLFTGDAVGLYIKGKLLPTTVPPSFDLEVSLATLARLEALSPKKLLFTHFGPGEPELVGEYKKLLLSWVERVRRHKDEPEAQAISAVLTEIQAEGLFTGGDYGDWSMSVRGVLTYLGRKEAAT